MRADARANRDAIVAAARRQLAAQGIGVPFSAIAEDAGVGIATLYRNFPTRAELVRAVLRSMEDDMLQIVSRFTPVLEDDPIRGWDGFVRSVADLRPGALIAVFAAEFVSGHQVSDEVEFQRRRSLVAIQEFLDRAKAAGLVRSDLTATQFQMGIASITRPLPDVALPDLAEHERWLIDVYLGGLRPQIAGQ